MDVQQLKTLIHVAELGSLSKAAVRLNIAQPALSRQIRLLEAELGSPLFERHGRGMAITAAGADVLERATRIVSELESIRAAVAERRGVLSGVVSIGMTPTIGQIVTVPLTKMLKAQAPHLSIRFNAAFAGYLIEWVQRGAVDVAFTYDPPPSRSLRARPVMVESFVLVGAGNESLSLDRPIRIADLADMRLVLPSAPHGLRAIVDDCARQAGIALGTDIEADSLYAMIDLVRAGCGRTVLPLAAVYHLIKRGELSGAPLIDPTPVRKVVVVYSTDRPMTRAARLAGECFTRIAEDLIEKGAWSGRMSPQDG